MGTQVPVLLFGGLSFSSCSFKLGLRPNQVARKQFRGKQQNFIYDYTNGLYNMPKTHSGKQSKMCVAYA